MVWPWPAAVAPPAGLRHAPACWPARGAAEGGGVARRVTHAGASSVTSSLLRVGIFLKPHGARSMSSAAPLSGGTAREDRSRGGGRGGERGKCGRWVSSRGPMNEPFPRLRRLAP